MLNKYVKSSTVKKVDEEEGIVVIELEIDMKRFAKEFIDLFKITESVMPEIIKAAERMFARIGRGEG